MARIPRPTKMKILEGEKNKDRINIHEPQPRDGRPTCPDFLSRPAKAEWKRIVPELEAMGLLTKVDRTALAAYCQAYGRWYEAENKIKKLEKQLLDNNKDAADAYLLKTQAGNVIISPLLSVANRCMEQMKSFMVEFGMTPACRSRISANPQEEDIDPIGEIINNPIRRN